MSAKDIFEKFKAEVDECEALEEANRKRLHDAKSNMDKAFSQYLIDEKILAQHPWYLHIETLNLHAITARLICSVRSREWPELSEIAESNYHCTFELKDRDYIYFDDGQISIQVLNIDNLIHYIQTYHLDVRVPKSLEKKREELKRALSVIEKWEAALPKSK
jgi:hypothetical protein